MENDSEMTTCLYDTDKNKTGPDLCRTYDFRDAENADRIQS